jgi:sulfite reductase (NADPH) flavoprotein alpha-component
MIMTVPLLPETAPFSPAQRAWLNGFFAGLLGLEANGDGASASAPAMARVAVAAAIGNGHAAAANGHGHAPAATATAVMDAEEEFPWHDPALPLDERLDLAEGRPHERKLMAAMAQLDCGACGYLCQTYAEAIAHGEEKDLTRCSPGGKETAKTLKALVAAQGTATTSGAAMTSVVAGNGNGTAATTTNGTAMTHVVARPSYHRGHPFPAKLIASLPLNGPGSQKDTRHVMIGLAGSDLAYKPGDALGVYPENCPDLVDEVLRALGADDRLDLRSALLRECALDRPSHDLLELLVESATDPDEADHLTRLRDGDDAWIDTADVLDVLRRHPSVRPDVEEFVAVLGRLQPRLYSISSSPRAHPEEVHLTVGVVRYTKDGRARKGVASTFLAERVRAGEEVRVFVHPSHRFQLPDHGEAPMIMIGPGTGIAPFRAFLEDRQATGAGGKNWLFFGDQCRATDFLYEEELRRFQQDGLLTRLDVAFSRDQAEKVYVQTRMLERAADLWGWLEEGAHVYVCGDAKRMASDVDRALQQVVAEQGRLSAEDAKLYVMQMTKSGRYQRDVY